MRFYIFTTCLVSTLVLGINMNNGIANKGIGTVARKAVNSARNTLQKTDELTKGRGVHSESYLDSSAARAILNTARNAAGLEALVTQFESATGQAKLNHFTAVVNGLKTSQNPRFVSQAEVFINALNTLNTRIENSQSFTPELIERTITEELSRPELLNRFSQSINANGISVRDVATPLVTNTDVAPVERLSAKMKGRFVTAIGNLRIALSNRATQTRDTQMARLIPSAISRVSGLLENNLMIPGPKASECVTKWDVSKNPAVNNLLRIFLAVTPGTRTYTDAKNQILAKMEQLFNSGSQMAQQTTNNVLGAMQRLLTLTSVKCGTLNTPLAAA